jgi:hypothetical protein
MGADYVLLTDIDSALCKTEKKNRVLKKFDRVDPGKIVVVVREVEGWYLAGLDAVGCKRMNMIHFDHTNHITKEQFDSLMPRGFPRAAFMVEILKNFKIKVAITKNVSLAYFAARYLS